MDLSRYADLFLTESREHLSAINHALLELERTRGGAESVGAVFRAVHTIKGMSATMGYTAVAELAHEMESLLDRVRRGERAVTPVIGDALFRAADALEQSIEAAVADRGGSVDVAPLVARLRSLGAEDGAPAAPAGGPAPASASRAGPEATPTGWSAADPGGEGVLVRVRIADGAPLRGVRAFLALQKARALGTVTGVSPAEEALQQEQFERDFAIRLVTKASAPEIERAVASVGDVDAVQITGAATAPGADAASGPDGGERRAGAAPGVPDAGARQQRHVRMDLRRLDNLMNLIGELVITRGRLIEIARGLADPSLDEAVTQASRLVSDLQDEIMSARMVPVWQVFDRFPRLVRDATRSLDKQIEFSVEGKEIELDRSMLDEIGDPIVHLLRNAIDHGIESPAERRERGKPEVGRLSLSAGRDRSAVVIRVVDDGRGIDRGRVLERAKSLGLAEPGKADLSDEELIRLISRPGFSTAERVSDISGRGVGIDAVQNRVRALGGSVDIRSTPGQGTIVTVRLPVTLAIIRALLARVNDETYALPMTHVNETVELRGDALKTVKGREVFVLREDVLPLMRLRELVRSSERTYRGTEQVVVLELSDRRVGLIVDELTGQQEIVVKQFDGVRDGLSLFSGATILGDGAPALILDVSSLL
ncbi:MAG TPA: chemotaxis protein CheA [Gemmatimonadaceae bacterium]